MSMYAIQWVINEGGGRTLARLGRFEESRIFDAHLISPPPLLLLLSPLPIFKTGTL